MGILGKSKQKNKEEKMPHTHVVEKATSHRPFLSVLKKAWTSERAHMLQAANQYIFSVATKATKPMVKSEVERRYNVTVTAVRMLNIKGKVKYYRNIPSRRTTLRKAIVTLKKGDTIDTQ